MDEHVNETHEARGSLRRDRPTGKRFDRLLAPLISIPAHYDAPSHLCPVSIPYAVPRDRVCPDVFVFTTIYSAHFHPCVLVDTCFVHPFSLPSTNTASISVQSTIAAEDGGCGSGGQHAGGRSAWQGLYVCAYVCCRVVLSCHRKIHHNIVLHATSHGWTS